MLSLLICVDFAAAAQDSAMGRLQAQYRSESNPVRKAKLLAKLGPLEVDAMARDLQAGRDDAAFAALERLRDDARSTFGALAAIEQTPSRHSAGFKELQIGLRQVLRRLNDLTFEVPSDKADEFAALRTDLTGTENSLIEALFPSPKEKHPKDGKPD